MSLLSLQKRWQGCKHAVRALFGEQGSCSLRLGLLVRFGRQMADRPLDLLPILGWEVRPWRRIFPESRDTNDSSPVA